MPHEKDLEWYRELIEDGDPVPSEVVDDIEEMDDITASFHIAPTGHCIAELLIAAFLSLSRARQTGMESCPLMIQEIAAYHRATHWAAVDFEDFLGPIQDLDSIWLKWASDEMARKTAKTKPK